MTNKTEPTPGQGPQEQRLNTNALQIWLKQHRQVSEAALAATFAKYRGEQWRYDTDEGAWLQWVGTHWARRQTPELLDALRDYLVAFTKALQMYQIITNAEAIKLQSQRAIGAVERLCRAMPSFLARSVLFDSDAWLLGTPGGTVNLRTGEMRAADPADFITKLTAVTPAPPGTPCPDWMKFLGQAMEGDAGKQKFLKQWSGINLTGDVSEQYFVDLYGPGGNGKSVFIGVLARILGPYHCRADLDLFLASRHAKHPTGLMDLKGARMVTCVEVEEGRAWDNRMIKTVTGGDIQKARRMHKDFTEFDPTGSITVVGDHMPNLDSVGAAMRRRVLVLEFLYQIPEAEQRKDLAKELFDAEGPAILRWAIDGCVDWQNNGFTIPDCVRIAADEYFEDMDEVGAWLKEHCEFDGKTFTKDSDLYASLLRHCRSMGRSAGTKWALGARLKKDKRLVKSRTKTAKGFIGIKLRGMFNLEEETSGAGGDDQAG